MQAVLALALAFLLPPRTLENPLGHKVPFVVVPALSADRNADNRVEKVSAAKVLGPVRPSHFLAFGNNPKRTSCCSMARAAPINISPSVGHLDPSLANRTTLAWRTEPSLSIREWTRIAIACGREFYWRAAVVVWRFEIPLRAGSLGAK